MLLSIFEDMMHVCVLLKRERKTKCEILCDSLVASLAKLMTRVDVAGCGWMWLTALINAVHVVLWLEQCGNAALVGKLGCTTAIRPCCSMPDGLLEDKTIH